ncbi:hypothetical protein G7K_2321-t1 [Saitoella complicata NRRL Y-17804]|uniref:Myb-like domain-containing protein n=1 Tax=Saitoella complicata (strain BCRC 22490 / CBS 7301 / JCM 7358 / NBRC 10748 / NRRL Y-17804) TaxID=698492 RepID=A0A0E9NE67_SAICN|nr:hypothetical protein G7K_2321-t1 [Saitoella complicata NRRL Y-17804]
MELFTDYDFGVGTGLEVVPVFAPDWEEDETVVTLNHNSSDNKGTINLEVEKQEKHELVSYEESDLSSAQDLSDPENDIDEVQVDVVGDEVEKEEEAAAKPQEDAPNTDASSEEEVSPPKKPEVKKNAATSRKRKVKVEASDEDPDVKSEHEDDGKIAKSAPKRARKKNGVATRKRNVKTADSDEEVKSEVEDEDEEKMAKPAAKRSVGETNRDGTKRGGYTQQEDMRMMILRAQGLSWNAIAKELPGRNAHNLQSHYCVAKLGKLDLSSITFDTSHGWSNEAVQFLQFMKEGRKATWKQLEQYFPGKSGNILQKYYSAVTRGKIKGKGILGGEKVKDDNRLQDVSSASPTSADLMTAAHDMRRLCVKTTSHWSSSTTMENAALRIIE